MLFYDSSVFVDLGHFHTTYVFEKELLMTLTILIFVTFFSEHAALPFVVAPVGAAFKNNS